MVVTDLANNSVTSTYAFAVVSAGAPTFDGVVISQRSFTAQLAITPQTLESAMDGTVRTANVDDRTYNLTAVIASSSTGGKVTNGLPDGMVFTPSTRTLSGTPTAAAVGVYDMTYTATNIVNETATQSFQLTVTANQPPVFSQEERDKVAASYSQFVEIAIRSCDPPSSTPCDPDPLGVLVLPTATGGEGDLTYSLTATSDSNTTANINVRQPASGLGL